MVQHIQRCWPTTKITWVIGKVEAQLLKNLPEVEFIVFDKSTGLAGYLALRKTFQKRHFDVLLHMQVALRASLASWCIPADIKLGFDEKRAKEGQWLFTNTQIEPQQSPHVLDGFMGFAHALGLPKINPLWHIPINDSDEIWASEQVQSGKPIAIIAPSASKAERNWLTERYATTADYLVNIGFEVVLCGGPSTTEKQLAAQIEQLASHKLTNLVGKTSLLQLLALLKLAHFVIAPDTGPAHMAVTVGTPVIGLYAHSNPKRTGPYLYQKYVASVYEHMIKSQFGKSANQLAWGKRAKGDDLMKHISQQLVLDKIALVIADFYPELLDNINFVD
jgi:heptosyltransferase I